MWRQQAASSAYTFEKNNASIIKQIHLWHPDKIRPLQQHTLLEMVEYIYSITVFFSVCLFTV